MENGRPTAARSHLYTTVTQANANGKIFGDFRSSMSVFLTYFLLVGKKGGWFLRLISKKWKKYILWLIRQDGT